MKRTPKESAACVADAFASSLGSEAAPSDGTARIVIGMTVKIRRAVVEAVETAVRVVDREDERIVVATAGRLIPAPGGGTGPFP